MPLTEKQREYLANCNHRWNVKTGATGSGKSFVDFAVTIPKRILAARSEGLLVLLGNTRGTLERNILEPMRGIWPGNVGIVRSDNTVEMFGKKVYALGADNKKHVARIQGATFEYVYGDEVTTWSEDVFQMLKSRLRCEHSHFDGTCNPDNPQHWFKGFLDSDADIYQQSYVIDDGVLPAHVVEELKKEYAGTVYYDRYILGLWKPAEGIIYSRFADCPERYLTNSPDYDFIQVGVDFGGNKSAFAFVASGIKYNYSKLTALYSERHPAKNMDPEEMYRLFEDFLARVENLYGKIDAVYADSAEQTLINGMRGRFYLPIRNSEKNLIMDRVRAMVTLIGGGRFWYTKNCESLKNALCAALYDDKKLQDERLDDGSTDIDTLDAFEYSWERFMRGYMRQVL